MSTLFDYIVSEENVEAAYRKCMLGSGKYRPDAMIFERNQTANISSVVKSLIEGTYEPDNYIQFSVYEPKERTVYAPQFTDKLVQMMVHLSIKDIYQRAFINDSYACIEGGGTHRAAKRIRHYLAKARWQYGERAHIIKLDIRKYFHTIDRTVLKRILRKKLKCRRTLWLLDTIIDSSPGELGLPLGNVTSHILANIYLNELDQWVKRRLRAKYYVRYMDDACLVVPDKAAASLVMEAIKEYLRRHLQLEANPDKTKLFPLAQGVNMVGYKIWPTHMLLRNDSKKRIKRKLKAMPGLYREGKMTKEKAEQMVNSWLGHAQHANSYSFIQKILRKHNNFLSLRKTGVITVNFERAVSKC